MNEAKEEEALEQSAAVDDETASLEGLSTDILAWLLSYLPLGDIASVSLVSQRLWQAAQANALWKLKFEGRWNIDATFRMTVSGQNWQKAYQEAYRNPHDLWIFHWNCTYPQDGLVPGRCCIYDLPRNNSPTQPQSGPTRTHDLCPPCRFFPEHPLKNSDAGRGPLKPKQHSDSITEILARATDKSIRDFCRHYGISSKPNNATQEATPAYSTQQAQRAFKSAATFHRTIQTPQYTAAPPREESESATCLAQLQDLLFFNVTDEPLSTKEGQKELHHLRQERDYQQEWEQTCPERRRSTPPQEFLKPAHETSHHTWHQAVVTNPDFTRPLVFRISVQRPDCFVVFPSEGFLEAGQSKVITFGVRPLGSLVATAFETINAQRLDVEEWMQQVYNEEATLPVTPFVVRYKYSSVIPCIPARGFISPHRPQPRHEPSHNGSISNETNNDSNPVPSVADICWDNKQMIDYHWSGGDPSNASMEPHEVRSIYLSAHVNAHYPFSKFRHDTLTPFDLSVDPSNDPRKPQLPMLFFAAPQLFEFYPNSIYPQLQQVQLETEVSHAGQVFRSHRKKCLCCRRTSWGPRLEEMGQAFVLARLEDWEWRRRQTTLIQNGITIVRTLYEEYKKQLQQLLSIETKDATVVEDTDKDAVIRTQHLLYVAHRMLLRYRSAPYISDTLRRGVLTRMEILADCLYRINAPQIQQLEETVPWRKSGSYRYSTCTNAVFNPQQGLTIGNPQWDELVKEEPEEMATFQYLLHTPGRYDLGPQEDYNHLGELVPRQGESYDLSRQPSSAADMFMNDPIDSFRCALITLRNPRSVLVHGIYDRVPYPGKVVRRPKIPQWTREAAAPAECEATALSDKAVFYHLQDALDLYHLAAPSSLSACRSLSLRRYLRNVPPLGMSRFPVSIDTVDEVEDIDEASGETSLGTPSIQSTSRFRITSLPLPGSTHNSSKEADPSESDARAALSSTLQSENQRREEPRFAGDGNMPGAPPLLRGPGPRLLTLLWTISAQLGWAVDDGSQSATSVFINRQLLIAVQWLSLTLMAAPLFWTLCARAIYWIPCKPVDYHLEDLPYQLANEMRFLSERECFAAAIAVVTFWLFLGRWTERWTSRDLTRAMLELTPEPPQMSFLQRVLLRYKRQWDEICPIFLQRLTYCPSWNTRSIGDQMKWICFWRSQDYREHKSLFQATAGRGLMFWGNRWKEIAVTDQSSRKLLLTAIAALGSFGSSTPHFWMNLLTVFSCSISLGLSMSLHSLERGVSGSASGSVGAILASLNLVTLVTLVTLFGQLLGSSGGVLFLAEFVVTSISFILGGAGTISASSVESWGCFFCLSSTAFWGYLFGRVALMDGIIRQKRFVQSSLFSTTLLCVSLAAVLFMWVWIFLWRWDVPASLVILRSGMGLAKTARGGEATAASSTVARSAAADYAAKNLQ